MAVCKHCQYQAPEDFRFCPACGKENIGTVLIDVPEGNSEKETPGEDFKYPWEDEGDEVVINRLVPADAVGQPFETYFYQPGIGYGYLIFGEDEIALKFPKRIKGGYGGSGYLFYPDFDADGDFDANDLGCLAAVVMAMGLGYVVKKLVGSYSDGEIAWSIYIDKEAIQSISLEGRTIEFTTTSKRPKIQLRVSASDGERLYRELSHHFPAAVSRWVFELRALMNP